MILITLGYLMNVDIRLLSKEIFFEGDRSLTKYLFVLFTIT